MPVRQRVPPGRPGRPAVQRDDPACQRSTGLGRLKKLVAGRTMGYRLSFPTHPMAKKSWTERNTRKQKTVNKYAKLRTELKAQGDYVGLTMLPRDASPTRLVNRCKVSGRRRSFLRRFEMSRITFREMASAGLLPGVTKSSW